MGDHRFDRLRVRQRETKRDGGAVVEYIYGIGCNVQFSEKLTDSFGEVLECEDVGGGDCCETEAREIGGDDVVFV